jgi:WD40 repeat protein
MSVAFSPNGRLLAVGSADKLVHLWDITNPNRPVPLKPLTGATNTVYSVAFSPDGRTLAAATGGPRSGSVWLWNMSATRQPTLAATLTDPSGSTLASAFLGSPDILVTGGAGGLLQLWNTSTSKVAKYVCAEAGTGITKSEWKQYIPGFPHRPPC